MSRLGIFSARDMRETASATRSSMGREALQKAMEACGAARHGLTISAGRGFGAGAGSGVPEHETGKMPMLNGGSWVKRVQAERTPQGGASGKGET